ncbi:hypothetical protein G3O08_09575 [Cryomorpha ignava]|uniref:Lipocalin-like domain-containing protein n=1 Tax=Cryomorpha ignava TaxID=101383 RepID=A0A7K3WQ13_9FLAO|nr:lipocalin-like domain-containing protein [Cryomorpha ignava]NEN23749.1 hypothetical protein [Cryomorpha ignava]
MKKLLLSLFVLILLATCSSPKTESIQENLAGLWSLKAMDIQDSIGVWHQWNGGMQGYLLYDGLGHGALHLLTKDYEDFDISFNNFDESAPLEALRHLNNSYVYIANYRVLTDEGIVEHERISHSNPGDWGKIVKRKFSFNGDTLILQPVEDENAALRLKWLKEK